ncbi:MarR family winged helix-turn-helix transcriptional regulator [Radiobacillus kanasensis]|uniref:MarR family winged helix-turn-helix transcriptional regulator n=1 Tax=Radiobacillus kanasensis TaxID=2844358 RepID=UPI001E3B2705|nr:MarR family winged helix-turn-helix transcriptional regulator [Radiobacillus kanasensis]UFT98336.1 MarR family winged helix-turn-helix transcriptional regulator [Radiobacillus kanasensis]
MTNYYKVLNQYWTDIYYHLHYQHEEKLTHQAIRIMQHVEKNKAIGINELAEQMNVSQNTASEHIKRLIKKEYVSKERDSKDERKVILALTEDGEDVLYRNTSLDETKLQLIMEQLGEEERKKIMEGLQLLSEGVKHVRNP